MSNGFTAPAGFQFGGDIGNSLTGYTSPSAVGAGASSAGAASALGVAGPVMGFFGAISGAYSAFASARSAKLQLNLQAELARINAQISESTAQQELYRGQREEQNARLRTAGLKSSQRVGMAANGIDLGSATATNILTTTDVMGEMDANTIQANAVRSAWGYRTQGVNYTNDALAKSAGARGISPGSAAVSSMLSGAGNVASSWYQYKKVS